MMKKAGVVIIAALLCSTYGFGQKQITTLEQVWTGYFNHVRLSDKWGTYAEVQIRTKEDFFTNFSQLLLRAGLVYFVNDRVRLTAGYAYASIYPQDSHPGVTQPEHRPWQQVQWNTNSPRLRVTQWFRTEERFRHKIKDADELAPGYDFNWRVRYNFMTTIPLAKQAFSKNTLSLVLNEEVMVNLGKSIVYNTFDQNRLFVGFAYHVNTLSNLQFGYLNVYQQLAAGNKYKMIHVPRVYYFHNIDLRKKHQ